jgi:hypothetical protein
MESSPAASAMSIPVSLVGFFLSRKRLFVEKREIIKAEMEEHWKSRPRAKS